MILDPHADAATIAAILDNNGVFAYPTEAVYGLGGRPNAATYQRIIELKGRDARKGVILVAASWTQALPLMKTLPPLWWQRLYDWQRDERATTFILPAAETVPRCLCDAAAGNIALRVTDHPIIRALCQLSKSPLISTSANLSGQPPAVTAAAVAGYFPDVPIIAGAIGEESRPSRIIDLASNTILRP